MKFSALLLFVIAIGAMALVPAFGQVSSRSLSVRPGSANTSGLHHNSDRDFALAAATFAKFSVIAGRLATMQARDGRLRELADRMAQDQAAALARLRTVAGRASIGLPALIGPNEEYRARIAAVRDREGAAFDHAYCMEQMDALQEAEGLLQSYAALGSNAPLRAWATRTIRLVREQQRNLKEIMSSDGGRP